MFRVYIDEAGDRGHHLASSKHFVVSAVIVRDRDEPTLRQELAALRAALGRQAGHVVHFRKLTHAQKIKACRDVAGSCVATIMNVIVCKSKLYRRGAANVTSYGLKVFPTTECQADGSLAFLTAL